ncbi:MAG: DUF1127 domain-containing protein [Rhodospirillaceae bacterium]|nr:DUF1127 domain-containing protein [Rhodospirillaceae bacterium]
MSRYTNTEKAALERAKREAAARRSTLGLIVLLGKAVVADLGRARRRAAVARELRELDARTLSDIGVDPWRIDEVARRVVAEERAGQPTTGAVLRQLLRRPLAWLERRRAYNELMALDDRLLRDIGINRADIHRIVYGAPEPEAAPAEDRHDVLQAIRQWNRSRATARTLRGLDARTLDDIGFVPGDIEEVSEELASRSVHAPRAHAA